FLASAFTVIRPIPIPTVFPYTTLFRSRIGFVAVEVARTVSTHSGVATYQKSAHFDFASARQGVYRGTSDQWAIVKGEENMFRVLIKLFTQGIAVLALLYFDVNGG